MIPYPDLAFTGPMCSGKSWCADYLNQEARYTKLSFAGPLKKLAKELFGVEGKDGDARRVYQQLGQKMREIDPDVWIKALLRDLDKSHTDVTRFVIDDVRYLNEAEALRARGFKIVYVMCKKSARMHRINELYPNMDPALMQHDSETEMEEIEPDYIVFSDETTADQLEDLLIGKDPIERSISWQECRGEEILR